MPALKTLFLKRHLELTLPLKKKSLFLFGARQTGKSSLIRNQLKGYKTYNLLESDTFLTLSRHPEQLRQEIKPRDQIVVIDEIQKLPNLLNEVQWLIEEYGIHFLLTGSSARKLRQGGVNLLGGRARSKILHPFIASELPEFDLNRALNIGLLPSIYLSDDPEADLAAYCGDYLKQEIVSEGLTRNIPAFSRFLEVAALCNGTLMNYTQIANDAQVPRSTIQEYFQILKDTLIAFDLPAWKQSLKRKPIQTSKFYFFDMGVARYLQKRKQIEPGTPEYGNFFEHYLFHELKAYADYESAEEVSYWRSTSGYEVDFILSDHTAIEVKAKKRVHEDDLKGLLALQEEKLFKNYLVVSFEPRPRNIREIEILPWKLFLKNLWEKQYH